LVVTLSGVGAVLRRFFGVLRRGEGRIVAALAVPVAVGVVVAATSVAGLLGRAGRVAPSIRVLLGRRGRHGGQDEEERERATHQGWDHVVLLFAAAKDGPKFSGASSLC
jgi:hypothetical protein